MIEARGHRPQFAHRLTIHATRIASRGPCPTAANSARTRLRQALRFIGQTAIRSAGTAGTPPLHFPHALQMEIPASRNSSTEQDASSAKPLDRSNRANTALMRRLQSLVALGLRPVVAAYADRISRAVALASGVILLASRTQALAARGGNDVQRDSTRKRQAVAGARSATVQTLALLSALWVLDCMDLVESGEG